ncbi:MAG: outer membrane protein assembly factor BamB family protein [Thermoguttaceae bacterium]
MKNLVYTVGLVLLAAGPASAAEEWPQLKFDSRRSGDVPGRSISLPLGLLAAVPLSDAVFTAPVLAGGKVFVIDGSGVVWAIDTASLRVAWRFQTAGGKANCNNVSSPAIAGRYLHVGTTAGHYYVLDAASGSLLKQIDCGEPILSAPAVGPQRVYFATLGSRVFALEPDGSVVWVWDFVKQRLGFHGDRWSGADWKRLKGQATWREQFCTARDIACDGRMIVVPAGGTIVWLEDLGQRPDLRAEYLGTRESPATLGLSIGADGAVYRQWTQRDNNGRVEVLRLRGGKVEAGFVRGTETGYNLPGLLSFSSVSIRGEDVYRCRPEEGFGLSLHSAGQTKPLAGFPAISSPILLREAAVFGGLDGGLHVVPLQPGGTPWSFKTAAGKAISAPVAVCDGRVYFGCEDGYLYVLGPGGNAPLPTKDLHLQEIRSPLVGEKADPSRDWFTSFGDWGNTNAAHEDLKLPLKLQWIRRYEGTVKHFSVCGGGRMYTHTAEGQVFAVEQETGRLLWRRYFPGVHVSYTSPLYCQGRLLVPQAGLKQCWLRCLDAATGRLLWQVPFTGSPSWNRQMPPIVWKSLVIYQFSSGRYSPQTWLFEHQSTFGFPADQKPLVRAWDLQTGKEVWTRDFSQYGSGGDDAGMCLMDDTLYYSCYFGKRAVPGVTAAMDPATGEPKWVNTAHAVHAGCTISGKDGRLYLGGYNPVDGDKNVVWCLDARDGSLVWKSEPVLGAIHVVTIGEKFLFAHAQYRHGYLLDKQTGQILTTLAKGYRCTRFTFCEPYLIGPNFDLFDLSGRPELVCSGPQLDVLMCVGALVSNGRLFLTTNGSGLQASMGWGE